jgi:hypothetical protein
LAQPSRSSGDSEPTAGAAGADSAQPSPPIQAPDSADTDAGALAPSPTPAPGRGPRRPVAAFTRRFRGLSVRRRLTALLALLVILALLVLELPQLLTAAPSQTVWQAITAGVGDGVVPKDTALEAFAYLYKVDIPGVTVPKGVDGSDKPTSGTGAMRWVQADWKQLAADQQAVINRYLIPGPNDKVIPVPTAAALAPGGVAAGIAGARTAAFQAPVRGGGAKLKADAPVTIADAMLAEVQADIAHLGPKLGIPVIGYGSIAFPNVVLTLSNQSGGNTEFTTIASDNIIGDYAPCRITAWSNIWQNQQPTSNGGVSPLLHVLITHEVVHCYQNVVWGDVATALAMPSWITEGTALWLAADDTGIAEPMLPSMWTNGYFQPETPLTNRSYDAFGYYSLLAHQGRDLWGLMYTAWQAAAKSAQRSNAFINVLTGDDPDIRDNWAESYLRRSDWGDPWIAYGFGLPDTTQVAEHPVQAQPDPGWTGTLLSRANTVLNVNGTSGEIVVVLTDGLASVHDENGNSSTAFQVQRFCTVSSCKCPAGTVLEGEDMAPNQISIPFVAAFNSPYGGSTYSVISFKLEDVCQKQGTPEPTQQQQPNYGPCGPGCTQSNGDPHLLTVNKYRYDFQAAGEFTLLRSADGAVDIQARQQPFGTSNKVSINTAIAAQVGKHRVGVYVVDSALQLELDGKPLDVSSGPKDLGGGARIASVAKGYEIDFPDGTQLWTLSVGDYGINAQIKPSATLAADGQGLLGTIIPGGLGVPLLPDGTRLPAAADAHQHHVALYGQFADAWRLTDKTALFDYDSGKSTASYTIKDFPSEANDPAVTGLTASETAAGESSCAAITDAGLKSDCIFDVGVSGQSGFSVNYVAIKEFFDSGIANPTTTPGPEPTQSEVPITPAPGVVTGGWNIGPAASLAGQAIGAGDMIYASVQTGQNTYSLMALDPVNQKILNQVGVPAGTTVHYAAGSVWLPGLITDSNGNNCSVTRFDGQTLAQQATIPVPCGGFGPQVVSDGDALWYVDATKYDLTTATGAVLTRIDPTTNQPGTSVPMPFVGGYGVDGQGVLFYYGTNANQGYYRLPTGSTALQLISQYQPLGRPGGQGVWFGSQDGKTAQYVTAPGSPPATLQIGGTVVAGDAGAVYADVLQNGSNGPEEALWRYPIDGSTPTQIAVSPSVDGQSLAYAADPLPQSNGDDVWKFWLSRPDGSNTFNLILQWTPLH